MGKEGVYLFPKKERDALGAPEKILSLDPYRKPPIFGEGGQENKPIAKEG